MVAPSMRDADLGIGTVTRHAALLVGYGTTTVVGEQRIQLTCFFGIIDSGWPLITRVAGLSVPFLTIHQQPHAVQRK